MPPKMESIATLTCERNVLEKSIDKMLTEVSSFTLVDDEEQLFTRRTTVKINVFISKMEELDGDLQIINGKLKILIAEDNDEEALVEGGVRPFCTR